jgi:RNA polymerase subunit RPABC4/transcription elongation factor Spt4
MYCKNCGQAIERGHKFCGNCGQPISQEQFESESVIAQTVNAATTDETAASGADQHSQAAAPPSSSQGTGSNGRNDLPALVQVEKRPCPRCKKLNRKEDRVCEWCGRELRWGASPPEPGEVSGLSFAGYADAKNAKTKEEVKVASPRPPRRVMVRRRRRSSAPVVEILVAILLLGGAATAIWIMRSSLPPTSAASAANIKVTVSPSSARVVRGKNLDFMATVSGTSNVEVNWSIKEGEAGGHIESRGAKAAKGKVWSQAVYSAPNSPGTYHLLAESKADSDKSAVIVITVVNR